jgi:hypothetical protein
VRFDVDGEGGVVGATSCVGAVAAVPAGLSDGRDEGDSGDRACSSGFGIGVCRTSPFADSRRVSADRGAGLTSVGSGMTRSGAVLGIDGSGFGENDGGAMSES